jgi:serine/threonine protein kinase
MDEPVAIKCLKPRTGQPALVESFAKRFRDETKIAYRLSQGNLDIVRSISSGTLNAPAGGLVPYMVLEWLEGHPLTEELFLRKEDRRGPMPLLEAVEMLDSAAGAIGFAHSQGVVHRDIKPGNLFLAQTRAGTRLKVLDFGLAKIIDPEGFMAPSGAETGSNIYIASPSYGAPEQFSKKMGPIGAWTDVYSLAMVLLEMMTGKKVRAADNLVDGMMKALNPDTASPTPKKLGIDVPPEVDAVFARATVIAVEQRYKDANEFWTALKDAMMALPQARDAMRTIASGTAPPELERARALIAAKERELALAATPLAGVQSPMQAPPQAPSSGPDLTKSAWNKTLGLGGPSPMPMPGAPNVATQRLGQQQQQPPGFRGQGMHTPTPGPVAVGNMDASQSGGYPAVQVPPPMMGMQHGPPSSSRGGRAKQKTASKGVPLWVAIVFAIVLGLAGASAIIYAVKTRPADAAAPAPKVGPGQLKF